MTEQLSFIYPPVKRCSKCGRVKPLMAFRRDASVADGHRSLCTRCRRMYERHYRASYPERKAARTAVLLATQEGRLQRPDRCERCGFKGRIEAHHWSYAPEHRLDVEWLCASCHRLRHAEQRAANHNNEEAA